MSEIITIPEGIIELKKGKMLLVLDDPNREDQADIIFPAETVTPEKINFLLQECHGFICAPITREKARVLEIPLIVHPHFNTEKTRLSFGVPLDAADVTSFGISASDRVRTIQKLTAGNSKPGDFVRPGHVLPLIAAEKGILQRDGHTEATIELVSLAGFSPVGVLCEVLKKDGEVAKQNDLFAFARKFELKIVTIPDLIAFVKDHPKAQDKKLRTVPIVKKTSATLPTEYGLFKVIVYKSILDDREHPVLIMGDIGKTPVITRVHSKCATGDIFSSLRCDCGPQIHESLKYIANHGSGILIYLDQEGRGIGLTHKIEAYALQEKGLDTVEANLALGFPADARDYCIAADILRDLGVTTINLLTNNPNKEKQLEQLGITISQRIPLEISPNSYDRKYLETKKQKLGHLLTKV